MEWLYIVDVLEKFSNSFRLGEPAEVAHISLKRVTSLPCLKKTQRPLPHKTYFEICPDKEHVGPKKEEKLQHLAIMCLEEPAGLDLEGVLSRMPEYKVG